MEQTINQFSKGLQLDTNPMVQSNDTLSDALNATFITQNGNEVILQNDMGNRRVDNAFLPSGYEPVGMKEYGGIIYIASYNPITGKSQIGSFPSPERKLSGMDDPTLKVEDVDYNINKFPIISKEVESGDVYKYITGDTLMFPLTDKTSLHAGDKFVVCGKLRNSQDVTNYYNTEDNKVKTPKNKLFTLSLGILNSQNEFVDITKNLVRWDYDNDNETFEIHKFKETESELYRFNYNYFIPSTFQNFDLIESINDANFIQERQKIAANTYSYKLVGPLYLKSKLNHFQEFSYNISGYNDGNDKFVLYIEGYFKYNCPDNINNSDEGDDNYHHYNIGNIVQGSWFILNNYLEQQQLLNSTELTNYNPQTNLYTAKVIKKYTISKENNPFINNNKFHYYLNVYENNHDEVVNINNSYFSYGLSDEGIIDLDKLGSGEIDVKSWRFLNNSEGKTTITYKFDTYAKIGYVYKNMDISFIDVTTQNESISKTYEIRNNEQLEIKWSDFQLHKRQLYLVKIKIKSELLPGFDDIEGSDEKIIYKWILTTDLFNDCYFKNSDNFIADYTNPKGDKENRIFSEKEQIKLKINLNIENHSEIKYADNSNNKSGLIKFGNNSDFDIIYNHKYKLDLSCDPTIEFNEELYPEYVKLLNSINQEYQTVSIRNEDIYFITDTGAQDPNPFNNIKFNFVTSRYSNQDDNLISDLENLQIIQNEETKKIDIKGTINFKDIFRAKSTDKGIIKNVFARAKGTEESKIAPGNKTNFEYTYKTCYGGVNIFNHSGANQEKGDYIYALKLQNLNNPIWQEGVDIVEGNINDTEFYRLIIFIPIIYRTVFNMISDVGNDNVEGLLVSPTYYYSKCYDLDNQNGTTLESRIQAALNDLFKDSNFNIIYMFRNKLRDDEGHWSKWETYFDSKSIKYANSDDLKNYKYNSEYSRVWIRTSDGQGWALVNGLIKLENGKSDITSFIAQNVFNSNDFIFCYRNELNITEYNEHIDNRIYIPDNTIYLYNDSYEILKKLYINSSIESNNINVELQNLENVFNNKEGIVKYPNFRNEGATSDFEKNQSYVSIKSNESITEYFNSFIQNGLSNIYIDIDGKNGGMIDSDGEQLNKKYVYLLNNEKGLIKVSNEEQEQFSKLFTPYKIKQNNLIYNTLYANELLLPDGDVAGLSFPYDNRIGEENSSKLSLYYDKVKILKHQTPKRIVNPNIQ